MNEIKKTNEKGFTLVELIVVIAILGILAAVAVPNYMNYQYRSRVNTDVSTAGEIIRAARTQIIETGKPVTALSQLDEVSNLAPISGGSFKVSGDTGTNVTVEWTATQNLCGDYKGDYKVEEGLVENTSAAKGGDKNTAS